MIEFTTWRSLVDGNEIVGIPDELANSWDAAEAETDNGDITLIPDQVGDTNLTPVGSPTVGDLNGVQTALLDGSNDAFDYDFGETIDKPSTLIMVISPTNTSDRQTMWRDESFDGNQNEFGLRYGDGTYDLILQVDSDQSETIIDGDQIITIQIDAEDNATLRANGDDKIELTDATEDGVLNVGRFGADDRDQRYTEGHIVKINRYDDELTGDDLSEEESRLERGANMSVLS